MNKSGKYLKRILRQKVWNDAFQEYLSYVRKIHRKMGGSHSIDIDYVEHILLDAVLSNQQIDNQTKKSAILGLNKLFWIRNHFFSMYFINQPRCENLKCVVPKRENGRVRCFGT